MFTERRDIEVQRERGIDMGMYRIHCASRERLRRKGRWWGGGSLVAWHERKLQGGQKGRSRAAT